MINKKIKSIENLTELIPSIKRARGYRLYDHNGNRYLDLWQNNGHGILGHRIPRLTTLMKNIISRGLIFDIPSIYSNRLIKELKRRYPAYKTFLITNSTHEAIIKISQYMNKQIELTDISDPAYDKIGPVSYDRPFLNPETKKKLYSEASILIPVFPFSMGNGPVILCFKKKDSFSGLSCSSPVSPVLLASLLRSLFDLDKHNNPEWHNNFIKSKKWKQKSLYILPDFQPEFYPGVFKAFLKNFIILSPNFKIPSILPGEASPGEIKKITKLFLNMPGE